MAFVHLHVHSEYSLLDGACRLKELVSTVKNMGQTAVAVTDHGVMYGVIDFYKLAKAEGIKPIIGCEVYVAPKSRFDKGTGDREYRHMVLLCKNMNGYHNLIALVSRAWTEGFYYKPRIDDELLAQYSEDLICLSACLAGEIPQSILLGDYNTAKEKALFYDKMFGRGNFYLELQDHGIDEQKIVNTQILRIADETGIPLVVTNDSHYISKEDSRMHEILLCIQTNHTINDPDKMEFATNEFYIKSENEMRSLFPSVSSAYDNTAKIADMCNVDFEFGKTKLPHFDVPDNQNHYEYFKGLCYKGLYRLYGNNPDKSIIDRLEYELKTILTMGFVDYFLIVSDFVNYAKNAGIPVGPGRGSGAGSLAAYCIGITGIDPIRYDLYFERFLNPERVSMPDFDIDFCKNRRQEVIDYVIKKYGKDHVSQISAFGTMAARGAIRDVGRAMAVPYAVVDSVSKMVPFELGITIDRALEISPDLKKKYDTDPQIKELIDMAKKIEGMPRHATTHAAGVVITDKPIMDYVPLSLNDNAVVTQYEKTNIEKLGLLKIDFLGLRTLTLINDVKNFVRNSNPNFSEKDIRLDDKDVFNLMSKGLSDGVFQFESPGLKNVLVQLKPQNIEDLVALTSLYRPGPMDSIPQYIENRHHPDKIKYKDPLLENILDVTYGCIVYQEQVMQIFRSLAGYSLGRADIVRRAMSKKDKLTMEREKEIFINGLTDENGNVVVEGCIRRGISRTVAMSIFAEMESFASYAFNKSHAVSYAHIAYETAWYKCHYPKEFMASLLTSVLINSSKLAKYTAECKRMGIKVLPPHVNESVHVFGICNAGIRYGLLAIKGLNSSIVDDIIRERAKVPFKSFFDFCKRLNNKNMNNHIIENLIKSGALDNLGANRRSMLVSAKSIMETLDKDRRKNLEGQFNLFDINEDAAANEPEMPAIDEFPHHELLYMEKDVTGVYLSGHPLLEYNDVIKAARFEKIANITNTDSANRYKDGSVVRIAAIVSSVKTKTTRNNQMMAYVTVEDMTGDIEMVVFPKTLIESGDKIKEGNVLDIYGSVDTSDEDNVKLRCSKIDILPKSKNMLSRQIPQPAQKERDAEERDVPVLNKKPMRLYLRVPSKDCEQTHRAKLVLNVFDGRTPVSFYYEDIKEYEHLQAYKGVYLNDVMINELKRILGDNNIVIK